MGERADEVGAATSKTPHAPKHCCARLWRVQQQGRLAEAAQCMEQAGELAAGRLYEQAAGQGA